MMPNVANSMTLSQVNSGDLCRIGRVLRSVMEHAVNKHPN